MKWIVVERDIEEIQSWNSLKDASGVRTVGGGAISEEHNCTVLLRNTIF